MTAQICAVNKTLMSVSKIASKGNRVIFDDDGSYIEDKETGERTSRVVHSNREDSTR